MNPRHCELPPEDALPLVAVQLPLRNERLVVRRLLEKVATLDWPQDRLEIQVLDDSDDETREIVDLTVEILRRTRPNLRIETIRRADRIGYKAGALALGMGRTQAGYLMILDADSQPEPDFLRRLMAPLLADDKLAFVQGRWRFDNERASLLCQLQALILHGLMLVEEARLSARGLPVQFNGTGGVWRRSAIEDAGGWMGRSEALTEDLDLSYRVELHGQRGLHLPEVAVTTELPESMAAFRAQQARWVRGGALVLRTLGRRLLQARVTLRERLTMLAHIARHLRQPLLFALLLSSPLLALGRLRPLVPHFGWPLVASLTLAAVWLYYASAMVRLGRSLPRALTSSLVWAPMVVALSLGLVPTLTAAVLGGLFSRRRVGFVRTPKHGGMRQWRYRAHFQPLAIGEIALGLCDVALGARALVQGDITTALGLGLLVGGGLLYVGGGSLCER
jgi:cellulose synthase/poly-beta-1,6-N-acetylglucosamine synthase-like glycosyltransferase